MCRAKEKETRVGRYVEGHLRETEIFLIHVDGFFYALGRLPFSSEQKWASFEDLMPKQSAQRKERVLLLMMLGVLVVLVMFFSSLIVQTYREYKHFKERQARIEAKLTQARKEFEQKEAYLARMLEDSEFLERVVRERLGYARPNEVLFRFSDEIN